MPLYEFKCRDCGLIFEELQGSKSTTDTVPCKSCGKISDKVVSTFSPVVAGGGSNESADMSIGREANKRWQNYHDRQFKRRGDKNLESVSLPKSNDGKFMPVMGLGTKEDKSKRTEYVGALQEHRKNRMEKGIPQFVSGPGPF